MDSIHAVNVFNTYDQQENNFTNGLFSLLRISAYERPAVRHILPERPPPH